MDDLTFFTLSMKNRFLSLLSGDLLDIFFWRLGINFFYDDQECGRQLISGSMQAWMKDLELLLLLLLIVLIRLIQLS